MASTRSFNIITNCAADGSPSTDGTRAGHRNEQRPHASDESSGIYNYGYTLDYVSNARASHDNKLAQISNPAQLHYPVRTRYELDRGVRENARDIGASDRYQSPVPSVYDSDFKAPVPFVPREQTNAAAGRGTAKNALECVTYSTAQLNQRLLAHEMALSLHPQRNMTIFLSMAEQYKRRGVQTFADAPRAVNIH